MDTSEGVWGRDFLTKCSIPTFGRSRSASNQLSWLLHPKKNTFFLLEWPWKSQKMKGIFRKILLQYSSRPCDNDRSLLTEVMQNSWFRSFQFFMIDLNRKSTIKKNRIDRKIGKKRLIYSLIDDRSFFYNWQWKLTNGSYEKWKDRSYKIENLWLDRRIDFWRPINRSWSKIDFWSEPLRRSRYDGRTFH